MDMTDFELPLSYAFADVKIVFPMRILMNQQEEAERQHHYSLPEKDQAEQLHAYNCGMLGGLLSGVPTGLPGFDAVLNSVKGAGDFGAQLKQAVVKYFGKGTPMQKKIVTDAMNMYTRATSPREFFREI